MSEDQSQVEQETLGDRIDIDLSNVDEPFPTVPAGNYTLTIKEAVLRKSKSGNPMLDYQVAATSADGTEVKWREYDTLTIQSGKYSLRQKLIAAGLDGQSWVVGQLIGVQFPAEVSVEEDEYGTKNRIKKILVDVPKNQR